MLQETIEEQQRYQRWHRAGRKAVTPRRLLQESDELLFWVEECLVQHVRIVPGWLIPRLMTVLRHAHPNLPTRLGRERRPEQVMEIIYDARMLRLDLHLHSHYSHDGRSSIPQIVERARECEFDRLALTDHNVVEGALKFALVAPELAIVGEEAKTMEGEVIGLFITGRIPPFLAS